MKNGLDEKTHNKITDLAVELHVKLQEVVDEGREWFDNQSESWQESDEGIEWEDWLDNIDEAACTAEHLTAIKQRPGE
jgi:hypothetical protein